ncbi:hypothetical protein F511_16418 [Dorcoceras hygrometricum]|uniref:Uncharacterized protein n=1 Tax=Dorcoceras hygrometricum TaxID=472368 RepID=A0A2Z7CIT1_9LAMI|nr:hypothetical protein F511_16418 [Dorcoceras hygrometricum]
MVMNDLEQRSELREQLRAETAQRTIQSSRTTFSLEHIREIRSEHEKLSLVSVLILSVYRTTQRNALQIRFILSIISDRERVQFSREQLRQFLIILQEQITVSHVTAQS